MSSLTIRVRSTGLEGVVVVEATVHRDDRGFFLETYRKGDFAQAGITDEFVQENHSRSSKGVLRGIHYQDMTAPMSKLVRCTAGAILDVAVDLRLGSPTFGRWTAEELTADNMLQIYVPVGFGHAFLALSEGAEMLYRCGGYYAPTAEGGVLWNDPEIGIRWPSGSPILSARDRRAQTLEEYRRHPAFRYVANR